MRVNRNQLSFPCPNCHYDESHTAQGAVEYAEAMNRTEWYYEGEVRTLFGGHGTVLPVRAWICRRCGFTVLQVPGDKIPERLDEDAN